jgi:hypothetical protein
MKILSIYSARTRGGREGDVMVGCWGQTIIGMGISLAFRGCRNNGYLSSRHILFWYLCFYVRKLNGAPLGLLKSYIEGIPTPRSPHYQA